MIDFMTEPTNDTESTAKRIRLIIDTDEVVRAAVSLRALKTGKGHSEVVNEILRAALAGEISEVSTYPQFGGKRRKGK